MSRVWKAIDDCTKKPSEVRRLMVIDAGTKHEQTRREFLADFHGKAAEVCTCGGPIPPTPQDPASVSARESALMAGWVPICDKCRRMEEEND